MLLAAWLPRTSSPGWAAYPLLGVALLFGLYLYRSVARLYVFSEPEKLFLMADGRTAYDIRIDHTGFRRQEG